MVPLSGTFYRIVFEKYLDSALNGVLSPEGRFHHDGEPAFYCSPTAQAASIAIDRYVAANDDARVLCKLTVTGAQVCDIRPPDHTPTLHRRDTDIEKCAYLGRDPVVRGAPNRAHPCIMEGV